MAMVLEYPFKIILFSVIILIIIGIMWTFRQQIFNICLFPPCDEEVEKCMTKTTPSSEKEFNRDVLEKYCRLCWERAGKGECRENFVCYVVNVDVQSNPYIYVPLSQDVFQYCFVECNRTTTSVYVEYNFIDKIVSIKC